MSADTTGPGGLLLTRRRMLAVIGMTAAAAGLGGCSGTDEPAPPESPSATPTPTLGDPDAGRRTAAVASARSLALTYDAAIATHAGLAALLGPLRDDHLAHAAALLPDEASPPAPASTAIASGTSSATGSPPTTATPSVSVPADPATARDALATAETTAAGAARVDAVTAVDPALARLLASIAASRALHATLVAA